MNFLDEIEDWCRGLNVVILIGNLFPFSKKTQICSHLYSQKALDFEVSVLLVSNFINFQKDIVLK